MLGNFFSDNQQIQFEDRWYSWADICICLLLTFWVLHMQELQSLWLFSSILLGEEESKAHWQAKPILSSVRVGPVGKMKPMCLLTTTDALDWEHKAKESCPCCLINIADKSSLTNYGIPCALHGHDGCILLHELISNANLLSSMVITVSGFDISFYVLCRIKRCGLKW